MTKKKRNFLLGGLTLRSYAVKDFGKMEENTKTAINNAIPVYQYDDVMYIFLVVFKFVLSDELPAEKNSAFVNWIETWQNLKIVVFMFSASEVLCNGNSNYNHDDVFHPTLTSSITKPTSPKNSQNVNKISYDNLLSAVSCFLMRAVFSCGDCGFERGIIILSSARHCLR